MPPKTNKKLKKRVSLYLSTRNYKIFMALCKLLSTSASAEIDKLVLLKIIFLGDNSPNKEIRALVDSFSSTLDRSVLAPELEANSDSGLFAATETTRNINSDVMGADIDANL